MEKITNKDIVDIYNKNFNINDKYDIIFDNEFDEVILATKEVFQVNGLKYKHLIDITIFFIEDEDNENEGHYEVSIGAYKVTMPTSLTEDQKNTICRILQISQDEINELAVYESFNYDGYDECVNKLYCQFCTDNVKVEDVEEMLNFVANVHC